jgi:hypothetical protein
MRYFTWKMDWSSGVGTDPTSSTNSSVIRFEPQFATGNVQDPDTLIYAYLLEGDITDSSLAQWQVTETTVEAMFAAALLVNPGATLVDGLIKFPELVRA